MARLLWQSAGNKAWLNLLSVHPVRSTLYRFQSGQRSAQRPIFRSGHPKAQGSVRSPLRSKRGRGMRMSSQHLCPFKECHLRRRFPGFWRRLLDGVVGNQRLHHGMAQVLRGADRRPLLAVIASKAAKRERRSLRSKTTCFFTTVKSMFLGMCQRAGRCRNTFWDQDSYPDW